MFPELPGWQGTPFTQGSWQFLLPSGLRPSRSLPTCPLQGGGAGTFSHHPRRQSLGLGFPFLFDSGAAMTERHQYICARGTGPAASSLGRQPWVGVTPGALGRDQSLRRDEELVLLPQLSTLLPPRPQGGHEETWRTVSTCAQFVHRLLSSGWARCALSGRSSGSLLQNSLSLSTGRSRL